MVSTDKSKLGLANEARVGNHGLPSRGVQKATKHMSAPQLPDRWFLVDAKDQILGRLAVKIAKLLMGKDSATFNRAVNAKTNVVVINARHIKLTGNKLADKIYSRHTGYPGGLNTKTATQILEGNKPTEIVRHAVAGMLPKNKLHNVALDHLKIFADGEHTHGGQNPTPVKL